jgi:hypothetical protein
MTDSHGTPSAVRQRCPVSLSRVRTLAVLALLFTGCIPMHWECVTSIQCGEGRECVQWEPGTSEEWRFCAKSCPVEQDKCDTGESCYCPDSPMKARCFDSDGNRIGVCMEPYTPGSGSTGTFTGTKL